MKSVHTPCTERPVLLRRMVAGLLFAQFTLQGFAQTSPAPATGTDPNKEAPVVLDTMVVTGSFVGSLQAAAEIKHSVAAITEVIAAEDIGKLPDISIADSLSRMTGLATQRLNGRSQAISIRGLTPDFSTGLLNGREQVSTNSNRAVEFDQYPSELLSGVVIRKSTDASLVGQGLSGTIDLHTVRPLSYDHRVLATNAFYEWTALGALNAGSKRSGNRYTGSYIDQFDNGKLGVAIGYSHASRPGQGEQWNAWGYPTYGSGANAPYVIGGAKPFVRSSELKRDGYMGVFEFKPTANFHSVLDLFYSKFKEAQQLRGIEIPLQWSSATLQPGYTVDRGLITQGTFANVYGVVRNDIVLRDDDVFAAGWNLKFGDGTGWTTVADASFSRIKRTDSVLETYSGTGSSRSGPPDTVGFSLAGGTGAIFTPTLDYTNPTLLRLSGPQGWGDNIVPGGQLGYMKAPLAKDQLAQFRVFTRHDLPGFFKHIEIGTAYTTRSKSEFEDSNYLALANGQTSAPLPQTNGVTDLSFIGIKGMASYDPIAALNSGVYRLVRNPNADVISVDWSVKEKVSLAYVQMAIDQKAGSVPVTGNLGVQVQHTDQSSRGLAATGTGTGVRSLPVTGGLRYFNVLPSLNLMAKFTDRQLLRLSLARQLARQRMADMRAGRNFGYDPAKAASTDPLNGPWSASGGNPALRPWVADSIDLSFENYFSENRGYFSLAGFLKKLRSYTYEQTTIGNFSGFPYTGTVPQIFQGTVKVPTNGEGGMIKGLEASLLLPSELLSSQIRGLGLIANIALTDSSIEPYGPGSGTTPIPGWSRTVANMTLFYEKHGLGARVSGRYRSAYRANISTFGPRGETFRTVTSETVVDAQLSYAIRSGRFKGITFMIQGYNLTDEPLATYQDDTRLVVDYQRYGPSYSVGVSYRF